MRTGLKFCLITVTLLASWAAASSASVTSTLSGTKHDFTSKGATSCVTCHTPHNPGPTLPLTRNHTLSTNTLTFGTNAATVAGTPLPTDLGSKPGTTNNCLSCHDGSVAIGSLIKGTSWDTTTKITGNALIAPGGSLTGNHPVGVPYPDQLNATYNSLTSKADPTGFVATPTIVKIYGSTAGQKGIECASCHDPQHQP